MCALLKSASDLPQIMRLKSITEPTDVVFKDSKVINASLKGSRWCFCPPAAGLCQCLLTGAWQDERGGARHRDRGGVFLGAVPASPIWRLQEAAAHGAVRHAAGLVPVLPHRLHPASGRQHGQYDTQHQTEIPPKSSEVFRPSFLFLFSCSLSFLRFFLFFTMTSLTFMTFHREAL